MWLKSFPPQIDGKRVLWWTLTFFLMIFEPIDFIEEIKIKQAEGEEIIYSDWK
jgi:hypothetical protein